MRILYGILLVFLFADAVAQMPSGFRPLFNGKNLKGWHVSRTSHQGTTPHFFVDKGEIVVQQEPFGQGGVLLTDEKYRDFELYVEVKIDSFSNGGIFIRSTESGQAYQIELSDPGGTGSLYAEAMQISKTAEAKDIRKVWKPGQWNSLRIRMTGEVPRITLWVNGVFMWEVQQPRNDFTAGATSGMIGLQSHWTALYQPTPGGLNLPGSWRPGGQHRFRNIAIREL